MLEDDKRKLDDCEIEIKNIKSWINRNPLDSNIKYLASYSIIKACGTIEIVYKNMIYEFLSKKTIKETKTYLERNIIDSSSNPNTGNILKMIEQFDSKRKNEFENLVNEENIKADLNSLVSLRNDIAHGRTNNVSIDTIDNYYQSGRKMLDILDSIL